MAITIGIPKESRDGERRVAVTPEVVKRYRKRGVRVWVEAGAGAGANIVDGAFEAAGAALVDRQQTFTADAVLKVRAPTGDEVALLRAGSLLIGLLEPYGDSSLLGRLARSRVDAMALELVPRISRAQSMDALSSQANIAGYRAVIEAAARYGGFLPMMMTAAGTARPAKVTVLGAGVAGLQAIATARRLGAQVSVFDVRLETREQVASLGAKFIDLDLGEDGSGSGGYAAKLSSGAAGRQQAALAAYLRQVDIVITTALVPGKSAPLLITEDAVAGMRAGAVIVDLAAASGGNCAGSRPDEVVVRNDVTIVGVTNYPALMAGDASAFYARNLFHLFELLIDDRSGEPSLRFDLDDDIIAGCLAVHDGQLRHALNDNNDT